ncbi:hypothetical protein DPMN_140747 [Dreissena polymorpha]|uniref:Uncharacterized protein n=1 Tax=Dreissena polymorpha TaxID=45954 RepID=A0A9D4G8A5_DREPO|nr:hypothetical protein DPMN_140747 [Dreissena polymorpha]
MPKTSKQGFDREKDGTFKRVCGAAIHDGTDMTLIYIGKGKKLKKHTLKQLSENNTISTRAKYICFSCV